VINHLKHVFSGPKYAKLVHWHSEKHRENDEEIQHLADETQWKKLIFNIHNLELRVEI
jgi:hypothetical protein